MILTVTFNPAADKLTSVQRIEPAKKLRCDPPRRAPGGGGVNVARAVARLEGEATAIWTRGGTIGGLYERLLNDETEDHKGLSHTPIPIEAETRENMIVAEEKTGRNFRFGMPGPKLRPQEVQEIIDAVVGKKAQFVVASGSLPPGVSPSSYRDLGRQVADCGSRFVLDSSGEALQEGARSGPYLVKPNRRELGELLDRDIGARDDIGPAAREVMSRFDIAAVMVSLGEEGVLIADSDGSERIEAPQVEAQSTLGAGDSMVGGLVFALEQGSSLRDAARYAVASGAAAVTTPGTELCTRAKTDELYERVTGASRAG